MAQVLLDRLRDRMTFPRDGFPAIQAEVFHTDAGTPYLRDPGVVMIAKPDVSIEGLRAALEGFDSGDEELGFAAYVDDPTALPPAAQLCKTAGQVCYASFGPKRTWNDNAARYFDNLIVSGHGSVLEHANFSFLVYGISRSLTHEKIRHRAGRGYSQLSQRYVSGRVLRFVERPEYADDEVLHHAFEERIDRAAADYELVAERLLAEQQAGTSQILAADEKRDERKKVQQTARSLLPNETETLVVDTGNVRAWRHYLEMRGSAHAEVEIRMEAIRIYLCLVEAEPILFGDYELVEQADGTLAIHTEHPKV
jgi:thymidylate synthase (FAD)